MTDQETTAVEEDDPNQLIEDGRDAVFKLGMDYNAALRSGRIQDALALKKRLNKARSELAKVEVKALESGFPRDDAALRSEMREIKERIDEAADTQAAIAEAARLIAFFAKLLI